jgi:60 kDa SS-A/Ro ribonucleoprotein
MANKKLFKSSGVSSKSPATDTLNFAAGTAYSLSAKEALAQMAATGCFNQTFYASAQDQLDQLLDLVEKVEPEFVAKVAVYARSHGFMRDMPAFLLGWLTGKLTAAHKTVELLQKSKASREQIAAAEATVRELSEILSEAFPRVADNGKMLRNYVQMVRSGVVGRKSLGSAPRRLVQLWFDTRTDEQIFFNSVGNDPSLGDVVALAHPRPTTRERAALYGYLLGRTHGKFEDKDFVVTESAPEIVRSYEAFKKEPKGDLPKAPYEMLEGLPLSPVQWKELATKASWQQTRQHLNTFLKKGVFTGSKQGMWDEELIKIVAGKLRDEKAIERARVMPYQLMTAYLNMGPEMPVEITNALQDAMEIATKNVPVIDGLIVVMPDISVSMHSPVTGTRVNPKTGRVESHTSKAKCIDVAALVAASLLRVNPKTVIIPFEDKALTDVRLNPRDSIMTNAEKLRKLPYGGTNCSAALDAVHRLHLRPDICWYVSDNESWVDSPTYGSCVGWSSGRRLGRAEARSATLRLWDGLVRDNPRAKLVCMDLLPNTTTQAPSRKDILNIGGFNDSVFEVVKAFYEGSAQSWIDVIEKSA